jgi:hypothetical protein
VRGTSSFERKYWELLMQIGRSLLLVPSLVGLFAGSALAQSAGAPVAPQRIGRGYVSALAGATIDPGTTPVVSIEYGEDVRRSVQAYVTFTYFDDLMTPTLRDDLARTAASLATITSSPWQFSGRDRGLAFVAGAKYLIGPPAVRPYVGAALGAINVKRTIIERTRGNLATALANDFNVGDPVLASRAVTGPLVEAAVGLGLSAHSTYVDIGYRYRRAFRFTDDLRVSQVSVGIGYRF